MFSARFSRRRAPGRAGSSDRGLALVTGASSGIGAATAALLAQRGFRVLAGVRDLDDAALLVRASDRVEPFLLDITNQAHVDALAARVAQEPRGLAALVNNAGVLSVGPVELLSPERWREVIEVNVLGTINVSRACIPALLRGRGRIVNISSPVAMIALPMFGPYSVSKFALEAFNDTLRRELSAGGVKVTAIIPGMIVTPIFDKGVSEGEAMWAEHDHSAEMHARYGAMAASALSAGEEAKVKGHQPEYAAALILKALDARRPRTHYRMGADMKGLNVAMRLLPRSAVDRALAHVAAEPDYAGDDPSKRPPFVTDAEAIPDGDHVSAISGEPARQGARH